MLPAPIAVTCDHEGAFRDRKVRESVVANDDTLIVHRPGREYRSDFTSTPRTNT